MHKMNFRTFDLNLLRIFDALMQDRHVTRTSVRLALSQPAVSHALNRLRYQLDDELFLRGSDGLRPTPRALEIAGPIRQTLAELERTLDPGFDAANANREFRVIANDYATTTLLPTLVSLLRTQAPGTRLRLQPATADVFALLDAGDADLALSGFLEIPERFEARVLIEDSYVCVMRSDHPLARRKTLDAAAYARAEHLLVSPAGDARGFADRLLAAKGLTRRVTVTVNQFLAVPALLLQSDLICTYPQRLAERAITAHPVELTMLNFPLTPPPGAGRLQMLWHRRLGEHAALRWLRECVSEAVQVAEAPVQAKPTSSKIVPKPRRSRKRTSAHVG
jgi:DNA-binding transcriptional LysR family regulator